MYLMVCRTWTPASTRTCFVLSPKEARPDSSWVVRTRCGRNRFFLEPLGTQSSCDDRLRPATGAGWDEVISACHLPRDAFTASEEPRFPCPRPHLPQSSL